MTIIEFFDENSIENISGALICRPERVVFVGDRRKPIEKSMAVYRDVLEQKRIKTELVYKAVNKNVLTETVKALEDIMVSYENCVFDISGGEELYLVALGVLMERYGNAVQCHRFNYKNERLYDIDADGNICGMADAEISVSDNVRIYGGIITGSFDSGAFSPEFQNDLENMWEICRRDARAWNTHAGSLGAVLERLGGVNGLIVSFEKKKAEALLEGTRVKYAFINKIMFDLQKCGLIRALEVGDTVSFAFKDQRVKKCMTVAGQVLELIVTSRMRLLKNKSGERLYSDIRTGVIIDWDGDDETDETRTVNEIDVFAMQGMTPIFISCKNGDFDMEELYKLNTVAERFGGKYARKVLVTTEMDKLGFKAEYLRARMKDMGIYCIDNADELSEAEMSEVLSKL